MLSSEQINLQIKLALIQALPAIIEKSVEPMKQIDGIKIVQVDGLTRGNAGNGRLAGGCGEWEPRRAGSRGGACLPGAVADHRRAAQGARHNGWEPRRPYAGRNT